MAILEEDQPKPKRSAAPPAGSTARQSEDTSETTPLISPDHPPPDYSESEPSSSNAAGSAGELEAGRSRKKSRRSRRKFVLGVLFLILGTLLGVGLGVLIAMKGSNGHEPSIPSPPDKPPSPSPPDSPSLPLPPKDPSPPKQGTGRAGGHLGEYDDETWKDTSGLPGRVSLAPSPSPPQSYPNIFPGVPLYSEITTVTLSSSLEVLQFHGVGSDARGSIKMVDSTDGTTEVIIEVESIYADKDRFLDRVRIHQVVDSDTGAEGVWILTPQISLKFPYSSRPEDWMRFRVTIYLPVTSRSRSAVLGSFEGVANMMSLEYAATSLTWDNNFQYVTSNSRLCISSPLTAENAIILKSTNGAIEVTSSSALESRSSLVSVVTRNGVITLNGPAKAETDLILHTSNGNIFSSSSAAGVLVDVQTTNSDISGSFLTPCGIVTTTNGKMSGEWHGITKGLSMSSSTGVVNLQIGLATPKPEEEQRIPVVIKTTNSRSTVEFTYQPLGVGLDFTTSTSNAGIEFKMHSNYVGSIDMQTSQLTGGISWVKGADDEIKRHVAVASTKAKATGQIFPESSEIPLLLGSIVAQTSNGLMKATL